MTDTLLPHNATPLELALEGALAARINSVPVPLPALWSIEDVSIKLLPWLAWTLSVDDWDEEWSPERKRAVVAAAADIHRHKGTLYAVRRALEVEGYGAARVIEDKDLARIGANGFLVGGVAPPAIGGVWLIGPDDPSWADYWIDILAPVARSDALRVAARLGNVAPARCRLRAVSIMGGQFFLIGDDQWLIGDDIAVGTIYFNLGG